MVSHTTSSLEKRRREITTYKHGLLFCSQSEIVSAPNFVVEVTKQASKHSLVFDCHFSEDEVRARHWSSLVFLKVSCLGDMVVRGKR